MKDKAFGQIRHLALIKTQGEHFFEALHRGTVSTNVFLRRVQNFALSRGEQNRTSCVVIDPAIK